MSEHSPNPIHGAEVLARHVFSPMHINKKTGKIMSNFFSHVRTKGCSIQRETIATPREAVTLVTDFLQKKNELAWLGVVSGRCENVRRIKVGDSNDRAVCVFDCADEADCAHAELCQTHHIVEEDDWAEVRHDLLKAFGDGVIVKREQYRNGETWAQLDPILKARPI